VPLRVLVTVLAVAAVALLLPRLADARACRDARQDAFAFGLGRGGDANAVIGRLREHCDDPDALAVAAVALQRGGASVEARSLARTATERYPASFDAWAALARVGGGAAAERRARALAPR
jgi:hypothetical protein